MIKVLFLFCSVFLTHKVFSKTIGCSHHQVCNLIKQLVPTANIQASMPNTNKDPHHYQLNSKDIVRLLSPDILVTAPKTLQPWLAKVLKHRQIDPSRITIQLDDLDAESGKKISKQKSHFWLYPKQTCYYLKQLQTKLIEYDVVQSAGATFECDQPTQLTSSKAANLKDLLIILGHDALTPLLMDFGFKTFSIISGSHHHEISTKQVKALEGKIKQHKGAILWVIEKQLHGNDAIEKYIAKDHHVLRLNTSGEFGQSWSRPLELIIAKLKALAGP